MIPAQLRKWVAFGSGVGIEVEGPAGHESLHIAAVRVRPNGARVLDRFTVEDFPHQAAGVWGTDYAAFLRKLGLSYVVATVILPRRDVIVRQLLLPGIADKDLAAAVQFQMDGLHPYAEDDVVSSWARLPGSPAVMIAIARRGVVDRYAAPFAEAGIKIASFTCSASALYSARRLYAPAAPGTGVLASEWRNGAVEFYGESQAHPVFSASFELPPERASALAAAELRLDPETEPQTFQGLLEKSLRGNGHPKDGLAEDTSALPYAAALASACPHLSFSLNLLPAEQRQSSSRMVWVPSAAFGLAVLMLAGALLALPGLENRRYLRSLQQEIARTEPAANRSIALDREVDTARQRIALLDQIRGRAKADMDVLNELTRILPPPTWVNLLEISRTQVQIAGETDQAAPLLKVIDASPLFEASEFVMPPARSASGEIFRIRTNREAGK